MTKPQVLATSIGSAGIACAVGAAAAAGPTAWLLAWSALSCALVAWAYLANRPDLLGKREGCLSPWQALGLLPFLLAYQVGCQVRRRLRDHALWNEVAPGVFVGARAEASRLPLGVGLVVDLTSEWSAPASVRAHPGYRSLPVLDGHVPHRESPLLELLEEVVSETSPVYIHCESGKGRAPTFAALVLMARGIADGPAAAIEQVEKGRPATRLFASDVRFIQRMAHRLIQRVAPQQVARTQGEAVRRR